MPRTYRLAPSKLAKAQRILGTPTATENIETALDSNLFIQAFRDGNAEMELKQFHADLAHWERMSAVVAQELLAGARTHQDRV